jgi:hypothetical protein
MELDMLSKSFCAITEELSHGTLSAAVVVGDPAPVAGTDLAAGRPALTHTRENGSGVLPNR